VEGPPWPGRFRKLCNCDDEGASRDPANPPPVEGREMPPVEGRDTPPVEGREIPPVEGRDTPPVEGREIPPVEGREDGPDRLIDGLDRLIDGLRPAPPPPREPPPPRPPRAQTGSHVRQHARAMPTSKVVGRFMGTLLG
ncbi:MAG: hypothetical protein ACYTG0_32505, partial [Planctomycetota bacterium]